MYRPRRLIRRKVHQVDSDCRGQLGVVISLYQLLGVGLGPVVQSPLEEAAMGKILHFDVEHSNSHVMRIVSLPYSHIQLTLAV